MVRTQIVKERKRYEAQKAMDGAIIKMERKGFEFKEIAYFRYINPKTAGHTPVFIAVLLFHKEEDTDADS